MLIADSNLKRLQMTNGNELGCQACLSYPGEIITRFMIQDFSGKDQIQDHCELALSV